jgi:xanthine dehydrogenase molybdopterin-binding subunit B
MMMYADQGGAYDGGNGTLGAAFLAFDNTYYCPNVYVDGKVVKTNTAPNTSYVTKCVNKEIYFCVF